MHRHFCTTSIKPRPLSIQNLDANVYCSDQYPIYAQLMQVSTWYACFRVPVCRVSTRTGVLPFRSSRHLGPSIVNPTIRFTTKADLSYTLGSGRRLSHPPSSHPQGLKLIHAWPLLESTLDLDFPTPRKPRALSLAIQPIYASPAGIHFTSVFVFLYATLGHHVLSVQLIAQSSRQLDITAPQWWTFGTMSVTTKIPRIWTRPATVVFCLLVPCFSRALRCVTI